MTIHSDGRLKFDSRRGGSGKAGGGAGVEVVCEEFVTGVEGIASEVGLVFAVGAGECVGMRKEVLVEVFDDESGLGGGDRLVCALWVHMGFMPKPVTAGGEVALVFERDQLDGVAPAGSTRTTNNRALPPNFQLHIQWARREEGGVAGGDGVGVGVGGGSARNVALFGSASPKGMPFA